MKVKGMKTFKEYVNGYMDSTGMKMSQLAAKLSGKMYSSRIYELTVEGKYPTPEERNMILIAIGRRGYGCNGYWKQYKNSLYLDPSAYPRKQKKTKAKTKKVKKSLTQKSWEGSDIKKLFRKTRVLGKLAADTMKKEALTGLKSSMTYTPVVKEPADIYKDEKWLVETLVRLSMLIFGTAFAILACVVIAQLIR